MLRSFFLQGRKWIRRLVVLLIPGTADSPERAKQVRRDPAETKPPADEEQQPVKDVADGSAGKTSPPSPAHSPASQPDTNPRVAPTEVDGHDRKTDGESSAPPDTTESQRPPISHHRQRSSPGHDHSASDQTAPASEVDTEGRDAQSNGEKQEGSKRRGKVKKREPSPPRQIGGRRHRLTQTQPSSPPTPESRPEVICRRPLGSVQWEVVLSTGFPDGVVKHDGKPIMPVNGEWSISSFDRHLSIDRGDGSPIQISLFDGSPMIFKLKKDWSGDGRKVIRITRGHFIVIVPAGWVRKGRVPHEPDPCSDCTFTAHYFFRDGSESHEELGGFGGHEIDWSGPAFRLSGKRVFDDSDHGLLFTGPQPPRMNRAERVVWGRVGEEATDGWKGLNFRTSESLADVLDGRQGHFFLRAYDEQSAMLDSVEFRYLRGLREIRVNGEPYAKDTLLVPPATGHHPTKVQFVGIDGLRVRLAPSARTAIEEDAKASLVVNPHPDADHVTCDVEADDGRVAVVVHCRAFGGEWSQRTATSVASGVASPST